MSLFDSISSGLRNLVSPSTANKISSGANKILTGIVHPIDSIVDFKKAQQKTSKESLFQLEREGITNTLLVTTPFTNTGKTVAGKGLSLLSSAFKAAPTTTAAAVLATPAIYTYIKQKPQQVITAPAKIAQASADLGNLAANPSYDNALNYITEHKIASLTIALGLLGALGYSTSLIMSAWATYSNTKALEKNTQSTNNTYIPPQIVKEITPPPQIVTQAPPIAQSPTVAAPMTTLAAPVATPKKKKKKKTKHKKKTRRSKKKKHKRKNIKRRKHKK